MKVDAVICCVGYDDYLEITLPWNRPELGRVVIVTSPTDLATQEIAKREGAELCLSERVGPVFAKGKMINDGLRQLKPEGFVLHLDADLMLPRGFAQRLPFDKLRTVPSSAEGLAEIPPLSGGVLYYALRFGPSRIQEIAATLEEARRHPDLSTLKRQNCERKPYGHFQIWRYADAPTYPETSDDASTDDGLFWASFGERTECLPFDCLNLPHGPRTTNWRGRKSVRVGEPAPPDQDYVNPAERFVCLRDCFVNGRFWKRGEHTRLADLRADTGNFQSAE